MLVIDSKGSHPDSVIFSSLVSSSFCLDLCLSVKLSTLYNCKKKNKSLDCRIYSLILTKKSQVYMQKYRLKSYATY